MLLPEEVPERVRTMLIPYLSADDLPLRVARGDGWDSFRRWGFVGPDSSGCLYAIQETGGSGNIDDWNRLAARRGVIAARAAKDLCAFTADGC